MAQEIEFKFLTKNDDWRKHSQGGRRIIQAYLSQDKNRIVRLRIKEDAAWLTVKGLTVGSTRLEYEYPIPVPDAEEMITKLCPDSTLEKERHEILYKGFTWEVDEFFGKNAGLITAEIELESEDQAFDKPDWLGENVSSETRYFNSSLIANPFQSW